MAGRAERTGVVLWVVAVLGAVTVLLGPLTPYAWVEVVGLAVSLTAAVALTVWFLRR